jgi:hypothetical protein
MKNVTIRPRPGPSRVVRGILLPASWKWIIVGIGLLGMFHLFLLWIWGWSVPFQLIPFSLIPGLSVHAKHNEIVFFLLVCPALALYIGWKAKEVVCADMMIAALAYPFLSGTLRVAFDVVPLAHWPAGAIFALFLSVGVIAYGCAGLGRWLRLRQLMGTEGHPATEDR